MLWVTVDGTGATKVLASSLLLDETTESIAWSCACFLDCFRVPPRVIFSDSAPAIKAAVAEVLPEPHTKHLLCIWHLSKNMLTALQPACLGGDLWARVHAAWWQIAKQSDKNADWDSEWADLLALVEQGSGGDVAKAAARAWLQARAVDKESWAYRYTWQLRTLGIHSTQRIESVHSAVDHFLGPNRLLTDLLRDLDLYTGLVDLRTGARDLRFHAHLFRAAAACLEHPFTTQLANFGLSAYATVLVKCQVQQSAFYAVEERTAGVFAVRRTVQAEAEASAELEDADVGLSCPCLSGLRLVDIPAAAKGIVTCSCQYQECYGLPCRHIMRVMSHLQRQLPTRGIDQRWVVRSEEQQNAAVLALLAQRLPPRDGAAGPAQPARCDRYGLIMGVAKGLAETGSMSAATFEVVMAGLAALHDRARGAVTGQHATAGTRGQAQAAAAAAGGAQPRVCHGCWQPGHNHRNKNCPRFKLPALEPPEGRGAPGTARVVSRGRRREDDSDGEGDDAPATPSESGNNDNVCHKCSKPGHLLCCEGDGCHLSWHPRCVKGGSTDDNGSWFCPVCTGTWASEPVGFVSNPPRVPVGRGGNQKEARKRPHTEGGTAQRKKAKTSGRKKEFVRKAGLR